MVFLGAALICCSLPLFASGSSQSGSDPFAERFDSLSWDEIVEEARGSDLYWYMWGGSESINRYVQGYIAGRLRDEYDIRLEMVPVTDASVYVSKVLGERQAGRTSGGSVDLVWINGENFRSMREADLLFGPYADRLPNLQYVDTSQPSVANDFGFPVNGYESPYGSAQFVMVYDSARVSPPESMAELLDWIRANPGRFTYPAPPDFTGSAFVRHVFYHVAGGFEELLGSFDQARFDDIAGRTWQLLNELEPFLWRGGSTYPETLTQQQQMFANSEVDFVMGYNPAGAANLVSQGRYPQSTRTFVFDEGTIGNTHYVAIPFNASHKAAALVAANLLLDPAAQYEKAKPEVWGDLPVVAVDLIPEEWRSAFASLPRPPSVLPPEELQAHRAPELQSQWLQAIEQGWIRNVLEM
jgi:putative spermidine/putrescine transport system substrate-binding protein